MRALAIRFWPVEDRKVPAIRMPGEIEVAERKHSAEAAPFSRQNSCGRLVIPVHQATRDVSGRNLARVMGCLRPPGTRNTLPMPQQRRSQWGGAAVDPGSKESV